MRTAVVMIVLGVTLPSACAEPDDPPEPVPCDDRYQAGMFVEGAAGALVTLAELEPSPPARYLNRWTLTVVDRDGLDVAADRVTVTTFMPAHGPGGPVLVPSPGDGDTLIVTPIDLWMPGQWQVDFHVVIDDGADLVRFEVCVPP